MRTPEEISRALAAVTERLEGTTPVPSKRTPDPWDEAEMTGYRDALVWVSGAGAEPVSETEPEPEPAKCGCHLNDEGRGHFSACPEYAPELDYVVKSDGAIICRYAADGKVNAEQVAERYRKSFPDRTITVERG